MFMPRPLFRSALLTVFAFWLGVIMVIVVTTMPAVPTMTTMPTVAEQMHRNHSGG